MKSLLLVIIMMSLLTCSLSSETSKIYQNKSKKEVDSISVGKKINSFFGNQVVNILTKSDKVIFNKVMIVEHEDTLSGEKSTFNKLKNLGYLSDYHKSILRFILLSDSTYVWSKSNIKHSFEPELTFIFKNDSSKVNVIFSPNSNEIGYRFKDFFKTIYIRDNVLIDDFFRNLKLLETKIDTLTINKDSIQSK